MDIGKRLKEVRGSLSQQKFAEILEVHRNTVARYERDERAPDSEYIELIYNKFSINPQWLLTGIGEKENALGEIKDAYSSIENILAQYHNAGLIPDDSLSEDEIAFLRIFRFLPQSEACEIIKLLLNRFNNSSYSSAPKYMQDSIKKLQDILKKGVFRKGVDLELEVSDLKAYEKEIARQMFDFNVKLINSYKKQRDKKKFIEKFNESLQKKDRS